MLNPQLQMSFPLEAFASEGGKLVAPAIKDWVAKMHARYVTFIRVVIYNQRLIRTPLSKPRI